MFLGQGKGGESIEGGFISDEFHASLSHSKRGIVSMANNAPNTNGSQFFITYAANAAQFDNKYTIIGEVIDGWETLDAMEIAPVQGKKYRPVNDIIMKSFTIHANPLA